MKKLLIFLMLILIITHLSSQTNILNTTKTDDNLHYMAGVNISAGVGSLVFYKTKRPFLSCLSGFVAGTIAGIIKESVYDKRMKMGTCDNGDAFTTIYGSLTGSLGLRIGINSFYEKKLKKEDFTY